MIGAFSEILLHVLVVCDAPMLTFAPQNCRSLLHVPVVCDAPILTLATRNSASLYRFSSWERCAILGLDCLVDMM